MPKTVSVLSQNVQQTLFRVRMKSVAFWFST